MVNNRIPKKGLTPYQGDRRTYGYFKCDDCNHKWTSAYSWADCAQDCIQCDKRIYPHAQRPLKKPKVVNDKPHLQDLCEKCDQLGWSCAKRRGH